MSSATEPQQEPVSVDGEDLPWVPFAPYSGEVFVKYHHIDPVHGEVLVSMRFPPGVRLPTHCRTGNLISHTLKGAWHYLEQDWVARTGGTVYEPAGGARTPESYGDDEAEVFFVITGELLFLDTDGNVIARENHLTSLERYLAYCREHGIAPRDLTEYR